jgi:uroporphyrinogen decarboxylase
MPKGGFYFDPVGHPLKNAKLEDLDNYNWPDMRDSARIKGLKQKIKSLHEKNYLVTVERPTGGFFEMGPWLRGYENFYYDLAGNPKYICKQLDKCLELEIEYWDLILEEAGEYIDVVLTANDFCGQDGLLFSYKMFQTYVKPRMKKLNTFIKKKAPHAYIYFHSCGSVYDLIPDFIETGIDILNPVQVNAKNMNTKRLKKEFGDVLTFWGGGVDTQKVLPNGTPQQVKDEVKKRIDDLAPGGGFVFATVHNIQPDVPPENIEAMWEALQEYGKY